jgi:hypothetical protein
MRQNGIVPGKTDARCRMQAISCGVSRKLIAGGLALSAIQKHTSVQIDVHHPWLSILEQQGGGVESLPSGAAGGKTTIHVHNTTYSSTGRTKSYHRKRRKAILRNTFVVVHSFSLVAPKIRGLLGHSWSAIWPEL